MAKVAAKEPKHVKKQTFGKKLLTIIFSVVSVFYVMPILIVLVNSFKTNEQISQNLFAFPNAESFNGFANYIKGMTFGNYPFWERSNTIICKIIYYFCIFSMVVPFQMVMFTLSDTANKLKLITPWGILLIYLGFGAGLSVFMFSGFVKSIPIEIEEAADVDGAGPIKTFFGVVLPIMKPTVISVAILETMWIWNDYLLPYLILDGEYRTIPIHMQFLNGSYGQTDNGAIMALVVLSIVPIVAFYFACQKYIIEGVVSGAVKG